MLLDGLLVWRLRKTKPTLEATPFATNRSARAIAGLGVLFAQFPLLFLSPGALPAKLWGDAETHARVARDIVLHGLQQGWLDGLLAGFPFAQHYPPLPWLTLALEISLGLSPERAIQWLGWSFLVVTPLIVYICLTELPRVSVSFAALGAVFFSWIAPYNEFFGGYEVFYRSGLISQTMGLPFVLLWVRSVVRAERTSLIFLWSALAMATHPQLSIAGVLFLGLALVALGQRRRLKTYVWGSAALGLFAVAIYGQGAAQLRVPFGWPESFAWRQVGFSASRLEWWLVDGDLFDQEASGVLTQLTIVSALLSLPRLHRPLVRVASLTFVLGLMLSVSGPLLPALGPLGAFLLKFIQPLRFVALLPPAAALLVTVVLDQLSQDLIRVARGRAREKWMIWIRRGMVAALSGLLLAALPNRLEFVQKWPHLLAKLERPDGYELAQVSQWLAQPGRGRIWYDVESKVMMRVFSYDALSLRTRHPIASTLAVGGHVGVLLEAYPRLEPFREGSARRAEALGVRTALLAEARVPAGWISVARSGSMQLVEQNPPIDLIGAGCISSRYSGSNANLARRLFADLRDTTSTDRILDPKKLVQLEWSEGEVREAEVPREGCSIATVSVHEFSEAPGRFRAEVTSANPVDVVVRAAYFPSFVLRLDGVVQPIRVVAPGFPSIRMPAGRHELIAEAKVWNGMLPYLGVATLGLAGLAFGRSERGCAAFKALGRALIRRLRELTFGPRAQR